jgi:hypothetical protein
MKATIRVLVTVTILAGLLSMPLRTHPPTKAGLVGTYYRGDHLGYDLTLELAAAGTYTATWTGCLGVYGTGEGRWTLREDRILLTPSKETGKMTNHLRELRLIPKAGAYVLVPPEDLKEYNARKNGASELMASFIAFHKQAPQK